MNKFKSFFKSYPNEIISSWSGKEPISLGMFALGHALWLLLFYFFFFILGLMAITGLTTVIPFFIIWTIVLLSFGISILLFLISFISGILAVTDGILKLHWKVFLMGMISLIVCGLYLLLWIGVLINHSQK